MADSTKDKAEGTLHNVKGAIKEKVGQATNNPDLQDEGTAEKIGGKVQKKIGEVEKMPHILSGWHRACLRLSEGCNGKTYNS